jgi:Putative Actinobacterial Holin-X, holin superfamily III
VDDDRARTSPGTATPASKAAPGEPPGLRTQVGAAFDAVKRLLRAHVDLAKAELGDILDAVKRMVALGAAAVGLLLFAATLLLMGIVLFLGEWLFGSLGWGVLLGFLLFLDIALVLFLAALDVSGRRIATSFLIAVALGVGFGLVLGFDVLHQGWRALGDSVATTVIADEPSRTVLVAVVAVAIVSGLLGFIGGIRSGLGAAVMGLLFAAAIGALLGWVTSVPISGQIGAALGTLVALIAWPTLAGMDVARRGIDTQALANKFTPDETIELTKETIEWVRARTPLVPKS